MRRIMGQLAIIKTGSTMASLARKRGDFEHWILAGMGLSTAAPSVCVVDVVAGQPLPAYHTLAGAVITGSHDMVTDRLPWSERVADWLPGLIDRRVPVLGICYGHQLLAYALGGRVEDNPQGRSFGSTDVTLTPAAAGDPLLGGLPSPFGAYVSHTQSVVELPPGARRLAASPRDPHHAFVVGRQAWGVQFHPEFDAEIAAAYIHLLRDALQTDGQDAAALLAGCAPQSPAGTVLARFAALAMSGDSSA